MDNKLTNEEKEQILKDICARLPYTPMVNIKDTEGYDRKLVALNRDSTKSEFKVVVTSDEEEDYMPHEYDLDDIKLYLRPTSSMTEEEKQEFNEVSGGVSFDGDTIDFGEGSPISLTRIYYIVYWLISHQFDYYGLILNGLALEAPEGMYTNNS